VGQRRLDKYNLHAAGVAAAVCGQRFRGRVPRSRDDEMEAVPGIGQGIYQLLKFLLRRPVRVNRAEQRHNLS
jgi:hypothetical protein